MTNKLVVIINSLKVPKIKKMLIWSENSCTKLQLPPELLTRGLPPPDPRSLCSLSSTEFVETPPSEQISWVRHCAEQYLTAVSAISVTACSTLQQSPPYPLRPAVPNRLRQKAIKRLQIKTIIFLGNLIMKRFVLQSQTTSKNVKFTQQQVMKAQKGRKGIAPLIL